MTAEEKNENNTDFLAEDVETEAVETASDLSSETESEAVASDSTNDVDSNAVAETEAAAPVVITVEELEKQGDVAADYIEELLDIADIDGDLEIEVRNDRPYISVVNDEGDSSSLKDLLGQGNQVLDAIQELSRLAVLAQTRQRTRLVLDIDNRRKQRTKVLEKTAHVAIEKVNETGENVHLDAMGSFERKLIHDIIAQANLVSESEGHGRNRHIVVKPGVSTVDSSDSAVSDGSVEEETTSAVSEPQLLESEEE